MKTAVSIPDVLLVANASQILAVDRSLLPERVGHLPEGDLDLLIDGIQLLPGR